MVEYFLLCNFHKPTKIYLLSIVTLPPLAAIGPAADNNSQYTSSNHAEFLQSLEYFTAASDYMTNFHAW